MVIKGTFSKKPPKPVLVEPKSMNPFITKIAALVRKPHRQRATDILYEVANSVAPLMQNYGLKVGMLQEMSPKKAELLGLNVNGGQKILLRLRPHGNDDDFLSMEEIMGTMLHELVHNSIGPHDQRFYKKLDEYQDKKYELESKGVTTIHGKGERLGGVNAADLRKARLKKLDKKYQGGVFKLGGDTTKRENKTLQELVREATIRRVEDSKWCHEPEQGDIPDDDELDIIEVSPVEWVSGKRNRSAEIESKRDIDGIKKKRPLETDAMGKNNKNKKKTPEVEVVDLTSD